MTFRDRCIISFWVYKKMKKKLFRYKQKGYKRIKKETPWSNELPDDGIIKINDWP